MWGVSTQAAVLSSGSFTATANVNPVVGGQVFGAVDIGFTTPQSSANYGVKAGWAATLNLVGPLSIPTEPEIEVQGNGVIIANGDVSPSTFDRTDFGPVNVDWATAPRQFAIFNSGDLPLNISMIASDNPEFSINGAPTAVAGGGVLIFTVIFDPMAVGVREATITIISNDSDEGTYSFKVQGTGEGALVLAPNQGGASGQPRLVVAGGMIEFRDGTGALILAINPVAPGPLIVNGTAGDDTLTVDFSGGSPIPAGGLVFNGGAQGMNGDSLTINGGAGVNTATYTFNNENDGAINYDGAIISYTGLEPVIDNMDAANRVFNFIGGAENIQVSSFSMTQTTIDSTLGESVTFNNPSASMAINAGTGDDLVDILSLSGGWGATVSITINGDDGDDFVSLNETVATAAPIMANGGADTVGDTLFLNPQGDGTIMKNTVTITGGGIQTVSFAAFETVTVNERPTATLTSAPNVLQANAGQNSYSFTVDYADTDNGVDVATIDVMDIVVTGPGGPVAIVMVDEPSGANGSPKTVTYAITPPGGTWNDADTGTYNIAMQAGQVADTLGSPVAAGALGAFTVTMDTTAPNITTPIADQINLPFQRPSYTVNSDFTDPPPAPTMLNYNIQANTDNMVAMASVDGAGVVTLSAFHKPGSTDITVRATDQGGNLADDTFTVTVIKADITITVTTDNPDPSETDEMTTINFTVSVTAPGTGAPVAPTGMVTLSDGDDSVMVAVGSGTATATFATSGAKTITATYAGDGNFNGSMDTETHVVNNPPVFTLTTDPLTINGAAAGYSGSDMVVQSDSSGPLIFTVSDFAKSINSDDLMTGNEIGQTVNFTITANDNPTLFAVQPTIGYSAGAGFADSDLTFATAPGVSGIATITVRATDNGFGGIGQQSSAPQTFCISVYGVRPFTGDLAIADRGARVYNGSVMLVHTNAGSGAFPTQSIIDNGLVDAYELTVVTNDFTIPGKSFLEYVVIDYETIVSAKGRGRQGLYAVNSVTQTRRLISAGQHFRVPLGVDIMPDEAGLGIAGQFAVVDAEFEPALGKALLVHPTTGVQTLLTQGGELFFPTGISVAPGGSPDAGDIYVTDVGNVFGKTSEKNNNPRKIVRITPGGVQDLLISEINNFTIPITNLFHPTGIDVDPISGDLYIADSFARSIWKLPRTGMGAFAGALVGVSVDADFLQPVHIAVAPNGGATPQFLYVTDGATVGPLNPYPAGTRRLHKVDLLNIDGNNSAISTIFTMDGFFEEPRGIEIIPSDPLTGN
jgi:hypothetical protein